MDRNLVYPGSIPLDTDLLNVNRNTMIALGALIGATLGNQTVVDGLTVSPTSPATMNVMVGPGCITQITTIDQTAYGSLSADPQDPLMKMGINTLPNFFTCAAPATSGQSIAYLIEAAFQESDADPLVLPYYNAANPAQPYLGPNNSGASQPTQRLQRVALQLKAGLPATTGTQTAPPADSGYVGLAVVTVGYAQTQVTATNIALLPTAPTLPYKLPSLRPGFSNLQAFTSSGVFVVPAGVGVAKVTVLGGGGSGGSHSTLPSGGGGAGGQAVKIISGLYPGAVVPVTVGPGGQPPAAGSYGNGGSGGTSSFGVFVSATGGSGGGGGTVAATNAGGPGGSGAGGDINYTGSFGTDAITMAPRGGDGGGPGGGRGTSGLVPGIPGAGFGGGGGGGGANQAGGGTGAPGGAGASGLVIVEF